MSEAETKSGPPAAGEDLQKPPEGKGNGRRRIGLVLLIMILIGGGTGAWLWYKSKVELTTEDAFIESHIHLISARVAGQVSEIMVTDNQKVAAGELLLTLDPTDFQARLAKAEAGLALARNRIKEEQGAAEAAQAEMTRAQVHLEQAAIDLRRGEALLAREVIPKERLDQLQTGHRLALASLEKSRQQLRAARAKFGDVMIGGQQARIAERVADLELMRLNLSYTRVQAPVAGFVTRKSVQIGNNVQPGQPLLALVELEQPWVVANYKENQLTHLEPGQRVEFSVDAYPGQIFRGSVDSIMAGTGAAFSLLPPENASGNYVKVVQRVPVKINIDADSDPQHLLRIGMSVVPTIFTGRSLGDIIGHLNPFD